MMDGLSIGVQVAAGVLVFLVLLCVFSWAVGKSND